MVNLLGDGEALFHGAIPFLALGARKRERAFQLGLECIPHGKAPSRPGRVLGRYNAISIEKEL